MIDEQLARIGSPRRAVVMGVINATPDSFSDGGRFGTIDEAISHGRALVEQGADIVDVGGESTRPGAGRVKVDEELRRVIPIVSGLAAAGIAVSVDTMRASVAAAAVQAGACLVNDVSGGLADADMLPVVAGLEVPIVLMHWRAPSDEMDAFTHYDDVVADVCVALARRRDAAVDAGISVDRIVLDPGLGFAKLGHHNWALLHELPALLALGRPVLIGASRKRFLGATLADAEGAARQVTDRDAGTHAVSALAAANGAWGVRVHDVAGTLDAVRVAQAWREGGTW
ncbi:MAG: dihydropteroate synthase [Candidatus Nanopelagicales bacterium]